MTFKYNSSSRVAHKEPLCHEFLVIKYVATGHNGTSIIRLVTALMDLIVTELARQMCLKFSTAHKMFVAFPEYLLEILQEIGKLHETSLNFNVLMAFKTTTRKWCP